MSDAPLDPAGPVDLVGIFGWANLILVTDNMNQPLESVSEPEAIAALWRVLDDLGEGWSPPTDAAPVARVRLNFRRDDTPVGNLGVGRNFLTAHVAGEFVYRLSDEDTARTILRALGVSHLMAGL